MLAGIFQFYHLALAAGCVRFGATRPTAIVAVRAGATLICPVKVPGGGVYLGDMHALQGDGEIAGHTCDVAGHATLQVNVIRGLNIDGPILFPLDEDLPFLARAMPRRERESARDIAKSYGITQLESNLPISFIGTGKDLNLAIDNGLQRAVATSGARCEKPGNYFGRHRDRTSARRCPHHVPRAYCRARACCTAHAC